MRGSSLWRFLTVLGLVLACGCAKPKYSQADTGRDREKASRTSEGQCAVGFANSGLCLDWKWEKKPTEEVEGSLIFKIYRLDLADRTPVLVDAPSLPKLVLWMPSMGHGSSPTSVQRIDTGIYRATKVYFVMPGPWELKFQFKNTESRVDEAKVQISI